MIGEKYHQIYQQRETFSKLEFFAPVKEIRFFLSLSNGELTVKIFEIKWSSSYFEMIFIYMLPIIICYYKFYYMLL